MYGMVAVVTARVDDGLGVGISVSVSVPSNKSPCCSCFYKKRCLGSQSRQASSKLIALVSSKSV